MLGRAPGARLCAAVRCRPAGSRPPAPLDTLIAVEIERLGQVLRSAGIPLG